MLGGGAESCTRPTPVLRTVTVGSDPSAIAIDEGATRALVVNAGGDSVSILDAATGNFVRTVHVTNGASGIVVDENTAHAFVLHATSDTLTMLDTRSGAVLRVDGTPRFPNAVAVDATAGRVFVASTDGRVTILNVSTHTTIGHN